MRSGSASRAWRAGKGGGTELHTAIEAHLQAHLMAYGVQYYRPKMHYVLHLADALRRHGLLLSTLTQERKHRLAKKYIRRFHQCRFSPHIVIVVISLAS